MKRLQRPGGTPPPAEATLDGTRIDLAAAAEEVARRYFGEFPEDRESYSPEVWDWAVHDTRYLLSWGVGDLSGFRMLDPQVDWLARVLAARGFPLERLARNLELTAEALAELAPDRRERIEALYAAAAARCRASGPR
ncbi:MAG TPA: hypothetical protein VF712_04165 [Thermoleophilaceae bacterium]|jgi:hypothetical protein